jgi:ABC-type phosphate/phosphonate transport system substrate-binding protein
MKSGKTYKVLLTVLLIAAATLTFFATRLKAEGKQLVFITPTLIELANTSLGKMISDITVVLSKETGLDIKMDRPTYGHGDIATVLVLNAMKANKAQLGYVNGLEYADLMGKYPPNMFRPEFTIAFNGKKNREECMYVAKNSTVTDIKSMKGLVWGGEETYPARMLLHENGIDTPLASFFKQVKYVNTSPVTTVVEALMKGEIDAFTAEKALMKLSGGMVGSDKSKQVSASSAVKEVGCILYDNNWIFGFRNDVPKDISNKITQTMLSAHKDKAFKGFQFMFIAIKGNFVPFTDADFQRTLEIKKVKDKYGWEKEWAEHKKKFKK